MIDREVEQALKKLQDDIWDELKNIIQFQEQVCIGTNGEKVLKPRNEFESEIYKALKTIPTEEKMKKMVEMVLEEKAREIKKKPRIWLKDVADIVQQLALVGIAILWILNQLGINPL